MTPHEPIPEGPVPAHAPEQETAAQAAPAPAGEHRWYHKTAAVLFITFCMELGLFLLIFPWTDGWDKFADFTQSWREYCDNLYVRGAISGLGIVNLFISLSEVFRLRRFAKR